MKKTGGGEGRVESLNELNLVFAGRPVLSNAVRSWPGNLSCGPVRPGAPTSVSGRGIDAWPAQFGLTGAVFC